MAEPNRDGARKSRFPLHAQVLLAMLLGLVLGPWLGTRALALGELGKLVITMIKGAATPLLFLAIVSAILKTEVRGRAALRLLLWAMLNASIALGIGLGISNLFKPGATLSHIAADPAAVASYAGKQLDLVATFGSFVPQNLVTPFAENQVLAVVMLALLLGFSLRSVRREQLAAGVKAYRAVEDAIETSLRVTELLLGWVIKLIPLVVFGVVAKAVAEHGYAPLKGLASYLAAGIGGLLLHVLLTYHCLLRWVAGMSLTTFWREAKVPVTYAAGANSSLATLPLTLRALDKLGVSRASSTLGAGVGTNFNNDGIILYEGMAVLFVAQAMGLDLSFGQQLVAAVACLVAAMGVAGVPEAGFVSLALVLNTIGLPLEILPLLLTVDWVIARGRSMTNVLSDMVLSILLDRFQSARAPEPTEPEAEPEALPRAAAAPEGPL